MAVSGIGATCAQSNTPSLAEVVRVLEGRHILDREPMKTTVEADLCQEVCDLLDCVKAHAEHGVSPLTHRPLDAIERLVRLIWLSIDAREVGR